LIIAGMASPTYHFKMIKLFFIFLSFSFSHASAPDIKASWMTCQISSDCILIRGQCGLPVSINREYSSQAQEYFRYNETCTASVDFVQAKKARVAECVIRKCRNCNASGSKGRCEPGY
jgi:hypothetical protein